MFEVKGQTIKLFGKRISLKENTNSICSSSEYRVCNRKENKEPKEDEIVNSGNEDVAYYKNSYESNNNEQSTDGSKTPNTIKEHKSHENDDQSETNNSQEKTLKKPDKIIPCPRCKSMDTKFCYYNNYNVSQPRFYCKKCQRYWTEGGSMRNVPVGSGRRKSKASFGPHYPHVMVSEADVANVLRRNNSKSDQNSSIIESLGSEKIVSGNWVDPNLVKNGVDLSTPWAYYPWYPMQHLSNSTLILPNFPVTFYPPQAYWGFTFSGNWNFMPNNSSLALGKRSRENDNLEKNDKRKSFRSKCDEENLRVDKSLVLQANPAALSRSLNFYENVY